MSNNKLHIEAIVSDGSTYDQYDVCLVHDGSLDSIIDGLNRMKESMDMKGETLVSFEIEELIAKESIFTTRATTCRFYKGNDTCSIYGVGCDCDGSESNCPMLP